MSDEADRLIDVLLRETLGSEGPPDVTAQVLARAYPAQAAGRPPVSVPRPASARSWALRALAATAAACALFGGAALRLALRAGSYPAPAGTGAFVVADQGPLRRGARVSTAGAPAALTLGGYCDVEMGPNSSLRVDGAERAEELFLDGGSVHCRVEAGQGRFAVRTEVGAVSVTGTEFSVKLLEPIGERAMQGRQMLVQVAVGTVLLAGAWGSTTLHAGDEKKVPDGGALVGVVVAKGETWIEVRGEEPKETRKYVPEWRGGSPQDGGGLDPGMLKRLREVLVGSRVKLEWKADERPRVLRLDVLAPPPENGSEPAAGGAEAGREEGKEPGKGAAVAAGEDGKRENGSDEGPSVDGERKGGDREGGGVADRKPGDGERRPGEGDRKGADGRREPGDPERDGGGFVEGIVTAKGDDWVEVKGLPGNETRRYHALWVGGGPKDGGGPDKEMLRQIREVPVMARVGLQWKFEEHLRVVQMRVLGGDRRPGPGGPGEPANEDRGGLVGLVANKGEDWIEIRPENGGPAERFVARRIPPDAKHGVGPEKEYLGQLRRVTNGDRVRIEWKLMDGKRVFLGIMKLGREGRERR
ncbi:MAG: FecR domain-containing protein [Planctomycetes bacterium]|nr:FecR domain-containing protein [Planctomycetota bacterium]